MSNAYSQVGIGTTNPDASAMLEIDATEKGFLPPRLSDTQIGLISNPATGLMVYNTDVPCLQVNDGTPAAPIWNCISGPAGIDSSSIDTDGDGVTNVTDTNPNDPCLPSQSAGYTGFDAANTTWRAADCDGDGDDNGTEADCGSDPYDTSQTCPPVVPDAPAITAATAGDGEATITFTAPADDGGSTIISYTATSSPGNFTGTVTQAGGGTITVTGLTNLETYSFTVTATNGVGTSLPSNAVSVIPGTIEAGGNTWMDRNLGASRAANASDDFEAYGNLFQWGRNSDGHEIINWTSSTGSDGAEQSNESTSQSSSTTPGSTFIIGSGNWYNGANPDDLWKPNLTGVNNPCPAGYRVPSETEFTDLGITNASTAYSSIGLPMAGYRYYFNGSLTDVGTRGEYWSSTISGTSTSSSRLLLFDSNTANMDTNGRAYGYSVRCLKD